MSNVKSLVLLVAMTTSDTITHRFLVSIVSIVNIVSIASNEAIVCIESSAGTVSIGSTVIIVNNIRTG